MTMFSSAPNTADISALLDDEIAPEEFNQLFATVSAKAASAPAVIESLRTQQYLRDALAGNACPDRHYTERIMAYIAREEKHGAK